MTVMDVPVEARKALRLRYRRELDDLDYRRELRQLSARGYTQAQIGRWLEISQPAVRGVLITAAKDAPPVEGFSGASPLEICQRYAAGLLERDTLVDELARWNYAARPQTDGYDWMTEDVPGAWAEVTQAHRQGLIDDAIYEDVFARRHPETSTT